MQTQNNPYSKNSLILAACIAFMMLLTRGSHVLTSVALPDASLALLLVGGIFLRKAVWFVFFALLATGIDFGAAEIDSFQAFCLTPAYWGMLPTYAVMWFAGLHLSKQSNSLNPLNFAVAGLVATFLAFVVSTQTYYLFSGRFPAQGVIESFQHGWEYLPSYLGFTAMYLVMFWAIALLMPKVIVSAKAKTTA